MHFGNFMHFESYFIQEKNTPKNNLLSCPALNFQTCYSKDTY